MTASTYRPGRRAVVAAAAALPFAGALAACSDAGDGPSLGGGEDGGSGDKAYDDAIAAGPIADDAAITASAWAKKIKEAGKLKRGGTTANQVFSLINPGTKKVTGFDAGITQLLARYILGKDGAEKVEYIDTTVETRETMVQNGTVDCVIATYSITPKRLEVIDFAGPYYMSGTAIQVRTKDKDSVSGPKDLSGKKLVTQANSTGIEAIEKNVPNPGEVQQLPDNESCVAALKQGRVDAYVLDQGVLLGNSKADKDVTVVGEPFVDDPYGIGLSKEAEGALDFVNGFLEKIMEDGTWAKLWDATVGQVVEGSAPEPPKPGELPA